MAMTAEQAKEVRLPTVCCILLTRDRPAMAARAVASFRAQTYEQKVLVIYDTSDHDQDWEYLKVGGFYPDDIRLVDEWSTDEHSRPRTIGQLRNSANGHGEEDIVAHWDSDDWSHPNRLAEQVALLQSSGADCVGYNEMLFWDTRPGGADLLGGQWAKHEAWLYRYENPHYALGTSLCYWRRTWEQHPFDAINHGEDHRFLSKCKAVQGVSSLAPHPTYQGMPITGHHPSMICSIHGGNSSPFDPAKSPAMCTRVPQWDSYCAERMALEVRA